jgi:putative oxidoreductase
MEMPWEIAMDRWIGRFGDRCYALVRIVAGFLFACHGAQKLFGVLGGVGGQGAMAPLASLLGAAGIIEFFGGTLIMAGLLARPVAFIASGEMAVAYFIRHFPRGWWPLTNGGELAVLYCFLWLMIATRGPGIWSLDRTLQRS